MGCIELKPCPDCGNEPKVQEAQGAYCYEWRIICYRCCNMSAVCDSYRETIESWNSMVTTRPDDDFEKVAEAYVTRTLDGQLGASSPTKFQLIQFVLWGMNYTRQQLAVERTRRIKAEAAVKAIDNYWESGNFSRDPKLWKMLKSALQETKDA